MILRNNFCARTLEKSEREHRAAMYATLADWSHARVFRNSLKVSQLGSLRVDRLRVRCVFTRFLDHYAYSCQGRKQCPHSMLFWLCRFACSYYLNWNPRHLHKIQYTSQILTPRYFAAQCSLAKAPFFRVHPRPWCTWNFNPSMGAP